MKLAEALILRADLRKRTQQLRGRLLQNAKVREGESLRALGLLGRIDCEFLRFADRALSDESDTLKKRLREILRDDFVMRSFKTRV